MDNRDKIITELEQKVKTLEIKLNYFKALLDEAKIPYKEDKIEMKDSDSLHSTQENQGARIIPEHITPQHAKYFYSIFKGRMDVYSKRAGKPNAKTGKTGYYTQCWNFWKDGVCPKKDGKKIKCGECTNQKYKQLSGNIIMNHLLGEKKDGSDVIGLYPMFPDETCNFLVFDFDNHDDKTGGEDYANLDDAWIEEVNAMRDICNNNQIDALVERSRSGKGAHIWLFFNEPILASVARKFGSALLTKGMETVNLKTFKYYDRMIPAQDHITEGGLGNLIALPLQGQALKNGNSAFIDEEWNVYPNQWQQLQRIHKLSKEFVEEKIKEWSYGGVLGILGEDISGEEKNIQEVKEKNEKAKPWEKRKIKLHTSDVDGKLNIVLANQIFIEKENVKIRMQNQLRRISAYSNPEFYKTQAMGFSTQDIPRIVYCGSETENYICMPRGCKEVLFKLLGEFEIKYNVQEKFQMGKAINLSFLGELYPEQKTAAEKMLEYDIGVLGAATAFGKTAVGAYLVAQRKVNTLILVHNREIMENWVEDFGKFLQIDEEAPEYITPKGRVKKRKSVIGKLYSSHNSVTGIIDVAMISSLGKQGEISELVKDYGMVIMDECHHVGAQTAIDVMNEVTAKYVYGLTATPKRDDGQEKKIFMQFGPIRYRYTAKDKAKAQGIEHYVYPRFTRLVHIEGEKLKINEAYKEVISNEIRNQQIVDDVGECINNGRTPLVLTKFKEHAAILMEKLQNKSDHIFLLQGGKSTKERDSIREKMRNVPKTESIILVAIGKYIGEGFNYPRLDTMMLTTPISYDGNVEQYAGRLHRDYEEKMDVIIYDYVDAHIRVLEKMYYKRLRTYKKIGYELCLNLTELKQQTNAIFDSESYSEVYERDLLEANKEIIISSPGLNERKIRRFIELIKERQEVGVTVFVITLNPENYPESRVEKTKELVDTLRNVGINVKERAAMHEHFAIIDKEIVWYGSMNMLSKEKEDDNLMRVVSREVALELMEIFDEGYGN